MVGRITRYEGAMLMGKPNRKKFLAAKARLLKGYGKMLRDTQELLADLEWWNANRTDARPFDVGPELVLIALLKQTLQLVESERPIPDELRRRINEHLEARAKA